MIFEPDSITADQAGRLVAVGNKQTMWQASHPGLVQEIFRCDRPEDLQDLEWLLKNSWWVGANNWIFNQVNKPKCPKHLAEKYGITVIEVAARLTSKDCTIELVQAGQVVGIGHCHQVSQVELYQVVSGHFDQRACMFVAAKFFFDKAEKEFSMPGRVMADLN